MVHSFARKHRPQPLVKPSRRRRCAVAGRSLHRSSPRPARPSGRQRCRRPSCDGIDGRRSGSFVRRWSRGRSWGKPSLLKVAEFDIWSKRAIRLHVPCPCPRTGGPDVARDVRSAYGPGITERPASTSSRRPEESSGKMAELDDTVPAAHHQPARARNGTPVGIGRGAGRDPRSLHDMADLQAGKGPDRDELLAAHRCFC